MKLKELVELLKKIEAEHGDVYVEVCNSAGDYSDVDGARLLGEGDRKAVYIDS